MRLQLPGTARKISKSENVIYAAIILSSLYIICKILVLLYLITMKGSFNIQELNGDYTLVDQRIQYIYLLPVAILILAFCLLLFKVRDKYLKDYVLIDNVYFKIKTEKCFTPNISVNSICNSCKLKQECTASYAAFIVECNFYKPTDEVLLLQSILKRDLE